MEVFLSHPDDMPVLSFVVADGVWDKPEHVSSFEKVARDAASSVGGLPVRMRLENATLDEKKSEVLK